MPTQRNAEYKPVLPHGREFILRPKLPSLARTMYTDRLPGTRRHLSEGGTETQNQAPRADIQTTLDALLSFTPHPATILTYQAPIITSQAPIKRDPEESVVTAMGWRKSKKGRHSSSKTRGKLAGWRRIEEAIDAVYDDKRRLERSGASQQELDALQEQIDKLNLQKKKYRQKSPERTERSYEESVTEELDAIYDRLWELEHPETEGEE